jgi:hypothetical protein
MRPESMKLFAHLLETYLPEGSPAMDVLKPVLGGRRLVKHLHGEMGLAHDTQYQEVDKIAWNDINNTIYGAWVLIKGAKGAGAIRATGREGYESAAFDPVSGAIETYRSGDGRDNKKFLKSKIGKLRAFYVGYGTHEISQKRINRANLAAKPSATKVTKETIVRRFRPMWLRAMISAEADIKGMIATMIKNSSYQRAQKKMGQAERLISAIEKLETGSLADTPSFVKDAVSIALMMAASHYYPEKTGEIRKDYTGYSSQFDEGPRQLLKDISEGDIDKQGTVLIFFKRTLISG